MSRKHVMLIVFSGVFLGLALLLSSSLSLAQPNEQSTPSSGWDEGRQVELLSDSAENMSLSAVPTTPGTTYRTYSGGAFQPTSSSMTYEPFGGAIYATFIPAGGVSFSLELDLPQGAKITEVVFFVVDNDAASNMDLSLRSYNPETNSFSALKTASSSGASTSLQTIVVPVDPPVQVDNTTTSYRLRVAPGVASSAHLLRGARIGYIVSQVYLPSVLK